MRNILTAFTLALASAASAQTPQLTVYTYDSFVSDWGPGPQVEAAFEAECACDLQLISVGDGAGILSRLKLEGARSEADIILGLDTNLTAAAADLMAPHGITGAFDLPTPWNDEAFLPFDWGYFAFVYDETKVSVPPKSFKDLIASDLKIVVQDPRTSTPGLGLMMWVEAAYGDEAPAIWEGLAPRILTVTKGWDEAYGMFLEGEADMVLSYTTSPSYHVIAEEDATKKAATFDEGHYMQIEVAGIVEGTDQPELAKAFMEFMISDAFQSIIPTTNWMYPAKLPASGVPEAFAKPIPDDKALIFAPNVAADRRDAALERWRAGLSK